MMDQPQTVSTRRIWLRSALPLAAAMSIVLSCAMPSLGAPAPTSTPTVTNTNTPTNALLPTKTATLKPTVNTTATREAQLQDTVAAKTRVAGEALSAISDSLGEVGQSMGSGSVLYWNPDPVIVESSSHNMLKHELIDPTVQGANFAFHSNITWEVKQKIGIVYCILMFRIKGDLDLDPWYMMQMGRISGLGHIFFNLVQNWTIVAGSNGDISNSIRDGNGDTNEVLLVGKGTQFTAYVNGKQVSVWWNGKIDKGGFGYGTMQDTGTSVCTFADNWIWGFE